MNLMRLIKSVLAALGVVAVVGAIAYYALRSRGPEIIMQPSREVVVLRTPGGMLELSTIKATEEFDEKESCQLMLVISCGTFLTKTSVVAHYTYRVSLSKEWRTLRRENKFTVILPKVEPMLPAALDTGTLKQEAGGTWSWITGNKQKAQMLVGMSKLLSLKASSKEYIDLQRESARLTAVEYVRKWLITQTAYKSVRQEDVRVVFEDESVGYLGVESIF